MSDLLLLEGLVEKSVGGLEEEIRGPGEWHLLLGRVGRLRLLPRHQRESWLQDFLGAHGGAGRRMAGRASLLSREEQWDWHQPRHGSTARSSRAGLLFPQDIRDFHPSMFSIPRDCSARGDRLLPRALCQPVTSRVVVYLLNFTGCLCTGGFKRNNSGCSKAALFFQPAAFKENVAVDRPLGKQMKYSGAQVVVKGPVLQFLIPCSLFHREIKFSYKISHEVSEAGICVFLKWLGVHWKLSLKQGSKAFLVGMHLDASNRSC